MTNRLKKPLKSLKIPRALKGRLKAAEARSTPTPSIHDDCLSKGALNTSVMTADRRPPHPDIHLGSHLEKATIRGNSALGQLHGDGGVPERPSLVLHRGCVGESEAQRRKRHSGTSSRTPKSFIPSFHIGCRTGYVDGLGCLESARQMSPDQLHFLLTAVMKEEVLL